MEEIKDPNRIRVTIADSQAPIVVLFGPPACGKTMTLVRLTRYLKKQGYKVSPIRTFRPSSDENYRNLCDHFDEMMNSDDAAKSTDRISFMLVEVIDNGKRVCQILEAPGEYYFDPQNPNKGFPNYVNAIINSENRKLWAIMVEPNWKEAQDRRNYVNKINSLKKLTSVHDDTLFVLNKVDVTNFVIRQGKVNVSAAIKEVAHLYPNIFEEFRNQNPITRFFKEFNCDFVPFQTGMYNETDMGLTFVESHDSYCQRFWRAIRNSIVG